MARTKNTPETRVERRRFLQQGALAGAALVVAPSPADTVGRVQEDPAYQTPQAPPAPMTMAAEAAPPADVQVLGDGERSGSDFMVDVFKSLGFEYFCANPGSSFRGLHESVINHGGNRAPELITCCHEESSVAMAHGYFKVEGKPLGVLAHGTVGLQHASMALYNAWCDRVPVYMILGNHSDAAIRRGAEWYHGVQDAAAMVRDYTKWDDTPWSLTHFAESAVRAYKIALTPPMAPVVMVLDGGLQEHPISKSEPLAVPRLTLPVPPQGEQGAVEELARMLVAAESPVLVADRMARTPNGMTLLVELAETLQAGVIDQGSRMNFPSRHPLNQTQRGRAAVTDADVIVGLEVADFWGVVNALRDQLHRSARRVARPGAKIVSITTGDLYIRSNYQDFRRMQDVDLAMAADAEATLPVLIEAVKRLVTSDRRRAFEERGARLAQASRTAAAASRTAASYAWEASPVSTARLSAEIWAQIKTEDWSLVSSYYSSDQTNWPRRLWDFTRPYQWLGHAGGGGIGYGAPASVGAALANRRHGRLSVAIQTDGDLMYAPGVLWTAAHHRIPLLSVMNNNRAYHQEIMHVQKMCNARNRGVDRGELGSQLIDPNIDFAKLAQSMGVYAEGPITNPNDLGPAIRRALQVVKKGEPALVDVVTQAR
ncbi:MAG: thiamine pyrophosphate-binding protein [Acidobacteria bacterium RIFCSPLOWO2_12_FULL_67_14]|nr:MAG: thiamine pyrophosphate-binding protein [Acidobacteria bacterium RIFCSPLOWO2_02_FULL_67_21]OFW39774.1 MAG: thiamine pyrophosphate-binding protein [Acidobacteria bacterium RIFCSPLOWO2_12_FULL_67_14]